MEFVEGQSLKEKIQKGSLNLAEALGDEDKAFELLDSICEKRLPTALWIISHPHFHPLREDPRYSELLRKIGFEKAPKTASKSNES